MSIFPILMKAFKMKKENKELTKEEKQKIIFNGLKDYIKAPYKLESNFISDLNFDSLDFIEFIMELESDFGIAISDEEAEKIVTVSDVVNYLTNNLDDIGLRRLKTFQEK